MVPRKHLQYGNMYQTDKYVRLRFETYMSLLSHRLKKGTRILDIGCYVADFLKILPPYVDYYGIDIDTEALKIANNRGAHIVYANLESRLPFRSKFDVIIATEVLEHLKDPEKLMLQIRLLLDRNGVVLFSLPNECTLYHRIKVLFGKSIDGTGFSPNYHLHFPTIAQSRRFVGKHFKIVAERYWIHVGVGGEVERFLSMIPEKFWIEVANLFPSLFARGVVFLCEKA